MQVAFLCSFRQEVAGMSQDLGWDISDLDNFYARKLWADFSFPITLLCFSTALTCGVFLLFLPLAITAFGSPEGYFSLAIMAFGAFEFIVPNYYCRLGKMGMRSLDSLI